MVATTLFLAASSILSLALAAPIPHFSRRGAQQYQAFGGDGSMTQGWPSAKQWLSFDQLW